MDIIVCIKQVPDPNYFSQIVFDPKTKTIRREGVPVIMNPVDRNAVEAALQLQERFSGKITVLTMGPPQAREALEHALAMGCDEAVLLCDRSFAGADAYATAFTIAAAIRKLCPFDLILCGNETADSGTKIVGPQIAEFLDIPYVTNVKAMHFISLDTCLVERPIENGRIKVELKLPALISVSKEANAPRIPNVIGIIQVAGKKLSSYGLDDLGIPPEKVGLIGSPTQVVDLFEFKQERRAEILKGKPTQIARDAVTRLGELGLI